MRVLMISTDKNIFDPASGVARRMIEYGETFGELHIIVLTGATPGLQDGSLSQKVFIYSTNASQRFLCIFSAIKIGKQILSQIYFGQTAITVQDPFETAFVGLALRQKTKYPLQIQLHTDLYNKNFIDSTILNWLRFQIAKLTLHRADGIRVVRNKIKDNLVEKLGIKAEKILTLPIYVDISGIRGAEITTDLHHTYPQWKSIILMASRLTTEKNISLALQAFKKVLAQGLNVGLVIVGEGPQKNMLDTLTTQLLLDESVVFEPWQSDLSSYYKTADLFLNTSNFEGFGLTLLEASAAGCPILTTNVGIAEDFFQDGKNAFVCPVGDKDCIANKLITFFSNESIQTNIKSTMMADMQAFHMTREAYLQKQMDSLNALFTTHP